jgi:hypothetical protein
VERDGLTLKKKSYLKEENKVGCAKTSVGDCEGELKEVDL